MSWSDIRFRNAQAQYDAQTPFEDESDHADRSADSMAAYYRRLEEANHEEVNMATRKKKKPIESVVDEFNEINGRNRTIIGEEFLCHGDVQEYLQPSGLTSFEVECRIVLTLEDGRVLNKVIDINFDDEDLD